MVDLFCGSGGMTLGLGEAARRLGRFLDVRLALDSFPTACAVYKSNFARARVLAADVRSIIDGGLGEKASKREKLLKRRIGPVTVLLGGPPCEGHSDLNNHTRRTDGKNLLYLRMARAAEILRPSLVAIENVPPVQWDRSHVVRSTREALEELGYSVHGKVVDMSKLGVPQRRRRYILLASLSEELDPEKILGDLETDREARTVEWAIGDLRQHSSDRQLDRPAKMSEENTRRTEYLFTRKLYDLPNSERPDCHKNNEHSYKSMYGRLRWDQPAQTITTGFSSMGQGRYIHPSRRRTITPHEAARLQTFPDWFDWSKALGRTALSTMIGNAVPPLMMATLGQKTLPAIVEGAL